MNRKETTEEYKKIWFRGMSRFSDGLDGEFQEIAGNFLCGDILPYGVLGNKQKALISLTALTATQNLRPLYEYTISALDMGAALEKIKETIYQCAPYIGLERAGRALDEVNRVFEASNIVCSLKSQSTVTEDPDLKKDWLFSSNYLARN